MDIVFENERFVSSDRWNTLMVIKIKDIIIEDNGTYYYIKEESEKVNEILRMPNYIKDDWMRYNRVELDISYIDFIIGSIEIDNQSVVCLDGEVTPETSDGLQKLKSIRRDLVIKKI